MLIAPPPWSMPDSAVAVERLFMRLGALLVVVVMLGACTGGPDATDDGGGTEADGGTLSGASEDTVATPVPGGSVFVAADAPPVTLNAALNDGNTLINSYLYAAVLSPLWRVTPDFEYEPLLLDGEPKVGKKPFSVTYTLKEGLQWNDGWPLTAEDVAFTHDTIMTKRFDIASRRGHELVRRVKVLDKRRVRFVFTRPYGEWRSMFSQAEGAILPKHVLRTANFNRVWDKELTASSGPFEFDSWDSGRLTLKRNEGYWGERPALDEIIITFHPDLQSQVEGLQEDEGEVDMLFTPAQPGLLPHLETLDDIDVEVGASTTWEHLDFNTSAPPLNKPFVRRAIAKAIDRDRIVDETVASQYPDVSVLNSVVWLTNQPDYSSQWSEPVAYDPAAAEKLLTDNGCRKRSGAYRCGGKPLTLDFVTNSDHPVRPKMFDYLAEDLAKIGIKLTSKMAPASLVFAPSYLASNKWDLLAFAHRGGASATETQRPWRCSAEPWINNTKYCNPRVDALFDAAAQAADDERRSQLLAKADLLMARDVPTLPLYQQGSYLIFKSGIVGPQHNPTNWGPLWNVGEWTLTQ